ncbi:DNA alkylation repair protein [Nocardioides caldifontis]|uniref:DNA alkylation repair protein n=1 Tax=Nocardioides caldifontis TaxID=2588938 RepID=UPI0011DFEF22|nr:DNA alkylation repair protein [Nocardioides caldifontis]
MTPDARALVDAVRRELAAAADPVKAPQMQRYMKSAMPFRGVNAPELRAICRRVFAAHPLPDEATWRSAVLALHDDAAYREERYAATELTGHRLYRAHQHPGVLDLYRHQVVTGAWWDLVDPIASNRVGPVLRAFPADVVPVLRAWARDDDLWLRRTAVISQLGSKGATDTEVLRDVLEQNLLGSRHGDDFFIRKAVGWALRQHARTDPEWVLHFVAEHSDRLSNLSRREALKHLP